MVVGQSAGIVRSEVMSWRDCDACRALLEKTYYELCALCKQVHIVKESEMSAEYTEEELFYGRVAYDAYWVADTTRVREPMVWSEVQTRFPNTVTCYVESAKAVRAAVYVDQDEQVARALVAAIGANWDVYGDQTRKDWLRVAAVARKLGAQVKP
jgi:hypothetical protein